MTYSRSAAAVSYLFQRRCRCPATAAHSGASAYRIPTEAPSTAPTQTATKPPTMEALQRHYSASPRPKAFSPLCSLSTAALALSHKHSVIRPQPFLILFFHSPSILPHLSSCHKLFLTRQHIFFPQYPKSTSSQCPTLSSSSRPAAL